MVHDGFLERNDDGVGDGDVFAPPRMGLDLTAPEEAEVSFGSRPIDFYDRPERPSWPEGRNYCTVG